MNIYEKEHLNSLRALLPECTVLLRKSGAFPLEKPCSLVLCGNGARHTVKGGTGSGEVNSRFFVSAEEGLKEAGFNIVSGAWLDAYDKVRAKAQKKFADGAFKKMLRDPIGAVSEIMGAIVPEPEYSISLPAEGEAAVYVLSRISGEGTDRSFTKGDFLLTDSERRDILALAGSIAPSIGLFGTVQGMIMAFGVLATTGQADPSDLAGSISIALLTTFWGLIISIIAIPAFFLFKKKAQALEASCINAVEEMVNTSINVINAEAQLARIPEGLDVEGEEGAEGAEEVQA